ARRPGRIGGPPARVGGASTRVGAHERRVAAHEGSRAVTAGDAPVAAEDEPVTGDDLDPELARPDDLDPDAAPPEEGAMAVFKNRPFLLLWLSQAATQIGGNMVIFGLTVIIAKSTGSVTAVSALILTFLVPAVLFSAVAGV